MRNELLLFAESQHESLQLHEVLDAGRVFGFGRSRLPQLKKFINPKVPNRFKNISRLAKWLCYVNFGIGYILIFGSLYLAMNEWGLLAVGVAFGLLIVMTGFYFFKQARRMEIVAAFLSWRSENQRSSLPNENSHTVQADEGTVA